MLSGPSTRSEEGHQVAEGENICYVFQIISIKKYSFIQRVTDH